MGSRRCPRAGLGLADTAARKTVEATSGVWVDQRRTEPTGQLAVVALQRLKKGAKLAQRLAKPLPVADSGAALCSLE